MATLVPQLYKDILPGISNWDVSVLVVDGNSPDGTAALVRGLQNKLDSLHLIVEEGKEGIGSAYFKGFRYAMGELSADVIIEFDGDLQHPPAMIPRLLERIDQGADFVVGSRRIAGGSWNEDRDISRRILSRIGGAVVRIVLFYPGPLFRKISDPTSGLRAVRTNRHFRRLDFDSFISGGFSYKVEMLFNLMQRGVELSEVPLDFKCRSKGESKLDLGTVMEMLNTVFRLRFRSVFSG